MEATGGQSALSESELVRLFLIVESEHVPAFHVLYQEGLPELMRIFDDLVESAHDEQADKLLYILGILAIYGSPEGAEQIVEAARRPLKPKDYLWPGIMSSFSTDHPCRDFVLEKPSDPSPRAS